MKRFIAGAAIGAVTTWVMVSLYDSSLAAYLNGQSPEEWIKVSLMEVIGTPPAAEPTIHVRFTPRRDLLIRGSTSSTKLDSGETYCVGAVAAKVLYERGQEYEVSTAIENVANVDSCDWPPGEYEMRLTWFLTDDETGIEKRFDQVSNRFTVSADPSAQILSQLW